MTYEDVIQRVAATHAGETALSQEQLVALVRGVIQQESQFNPRAFRSEPQLHDASRGLMQVLATTARRLGYGGPVGDDATHMGGLYEPHRNIALGTKLLIQNLQQANGEIDVAVSAYNAGFSATRPWDGKRERPGGPFVNQAYVDRVREYYEKYLAASAEVTPSPPESGSSSQWRLAALVGGGVVLWLLFR